jgi:DNA gyrase subunit A
MNVADTKDPKDPNNENEHTEEGQAPEVSAEVIEEQDKNAAGNVLTYELGTEMQQSFLEYSMSVIISRALPDVRDGLKPVHRRILWAMYESGSTPNKPHVKSARTVGDVIGKYHPHGDSAVYDAMVRLAQPFNMSLPLVDGHGNFGSIDGDSAAAMRYTEARLAKPAMEMLEGLRQETVDFQPNYDESLQEPAVLPARFPNLLVNGSSGIAVGMATNIPPHNLGETIAAARMLLDNPDATIDDLMTVLPGPDFPTGGIIMGREGIKEAYETGRGHIPVRAKCEIKEKKNGKSQIIVSEIPYQVNRSRLLQSLADLVREKKLPEVSNIHDGADRHGIDIIIELKQNALPQVVLNKLFKHTQLQVNFGVIMIALVNGMPKVLNLKQILEYYIKHQEDVIVRRTKFELRKAEERAHILEGLVIAVDNIDEVVEIIRSSANDQEANDRLRGRFGLSERQAEAILDMRLRRLTALQREKLVAELEELKKQIAEYKRILSDESLVKQIIKDELEEIANKYKTPRRTRISGPAKDIDVEDLIADEEVAVTITQAGYIKRMPITTYRQQKRGGKGMSGVNLKDNDFVEHIFTASTHDYMLFFTSLGKVYRLKVYEVPEASRHARGTAIVNLLHLHKGETVAASIAARDFPEDEFLMFATAQGMVKKTAMSAYDRTRQDGLIAINLRDGDELIAVRRVKPGESVIMASAAGKAIRWDESEVRTMGRDTMGVRGMTLEDDGEDHVLGMEIANEDSQLLVITEKGYGKRTPISEYPSHHRGGKGVQTLTMTVKKGRLAAMKVVNEGDELMIISEEGIVVRTPAKGVSQLGRATQGVRIMDIAKKDRVTAVAIANEGDRPKPDKKAIDEPETLVEAASREEIARSIKGDDADEDAENDEK